MFRARVYRFGRVRVALLLATGLLVAAGGQVQVSAQNGAIAASPGATPGTPTGSPVAGSGMILITRYSCTSSAQASHIDVFPAGTPVTTDDLQANGCVRAADDFILLWNSGTRARQIPIPGSGIAVVQDLAPGAAADTYRLVYFGLNRLDLCSHHRQSIDIGDRLSVRDRAAHRNSVSDHGTVPYLSTLSDRGAVSDRTIRSRRSTMRRKSPERSQTTAMTAGHPTARNSSPRVRTAPNRGRC